MFITKHANHKATARRTQSDFVALYHPFGANKATEKLAFSGFLTRLDFVHIVSIA